MEETTMIRRKENNLPRSRALAHVAGLIALLLVPLFPLAPAATAVTPIPSGGFATSPGLSNEAAPQIRFDEFQSALKLAVRAQEAFDQGVYDDAVVFYQQALPLFERAVGPEDLRIVGPLAGLADLYQARGEFDRAELLYRRVAFLMEQAFDPSDIHVGAALASTAEAVASQGHYGQAASICERALSIYQATLGADDPRTVRVLREYAGLLAKLNRRDKAEALKSPVSRIPHNGELLSRPGAIARSPQNQVMLKGR